MATVFSVTEYQAAADEYEKVWRLTDHVHESQNSSGKEVM